MKCIMQKMIFPILVMFLLSRVLFAQQGWFVLNSNTKVNINQLFFIHENTGFAVCDNRLLLETTNAGVSWTKVRGPFLGNLKTVSFFDPSVGIISSDTGMYRSFTGGIVWKVCYENIGTLDCSLAGNTVFASYIDNSSSGITHSTDRGLLWNLVYPLQSAPKLCFVNAAIGYGIEFYRNAGTESYLLNKTTNGGIQWSYMASFSSQSFSGAAGALYFLNTESGFFSFKNESGSYIYRVVSGVVYTAAMPDFQRGISFIDNNNGWSAGENGSVYKTTNAGVTWVKGSTPVNTTLNHVLFLNSLTGYACGDNGVILKTTDGGIIAVEPQSTVIPEYFSLSQNYPNPFNPSTKISFNIPLLRGVDADGGRGVLVRLIIYDALGREITTLVNEQLQPGEYSVTWDASAYPSGVYFYRLVAGEFIQTKKLALIK